VYELDRDGDVEFFTMEFLERRAAEFGDREDGFRCAVEMRAWAIILEGGAGLAHAHSRSVVHGDLKPQNIMITNTGETRILGFGASGGGSRRKALRAR